MLAPIVLLAASLAAQDPTITSAVGNGQAGFSGDGGPAAEAKLNMPFDVAFDALGNLYLSDTFNQRIRKVDATSGLITTIAGSGEKGFSGDGGPATQAAMDEPYGLAIDPVGNLYFADRLNARVRRVDAKIGPHHDGRRERLEDLFGRRRPGQGGRARRAERRGARRPGPALHRRRRRSSRPRRGPRDGPDRHLRGRRPRPARR